MLFSPDQLNDIGRQVGFLQRCRKVTPALLIPSLISSLATPDVKSIADLSRSFETDTDQDVGERSFRDRLEPPAFAVLMRTLFLRTAESLVLQALRFSPGSSFARFGQVLIQDGTSFAVHKELATIFPGRFNKNSPAAVELHLTLDLLTGSPDQISLTPDTTSERAHLPSPLSLVGSLLLADRGYPSWEYLAGVEAAGGHFVMRGKANLSCPVMGVYRAGDLVELEVPLPLKQYLARHPNGLLDLVIQTLVNGKAFHFRVVMLPTPKGRTFLLTNLPASDFPAEVVGVAYRLRWQIELLFKEWKSHANLHRFVTREPAIVEGLIWGSLIVSLLNRFLSHAAQIVGQVAISTLKAAKMMSKHLPPLMRAILRDADCEAVFTTVVEALGRQARRSHPKREMRSGRASSGLLPCFQL